MTSPQALRLAYRHVRVAERINRFNVMYERTNEFDCEWLLSDLQEATAAGHNEVATLLERALLARLSWCNPWTASLIGKSLDQLVIGCGGGGRGQQCGHVDDCESWCPNMLQAARDDAALAAQAREEAMQVMAMQVMAMGEEE